MASQKFTQLVEKPIAGFEVSLTLVDSFAQDGSANSLMTSEEVIRDWISTKWADAVTASITYKDKNGNTTWPFNSFNLDALLEWAQADEGHIAIKYETTGTTYTLKAFLPLAQNGAIQFSNDETMEIEIVYDSAEISAVAIELIESPVAAPMWNKFERITVRDGDKEKDIKLDGIETLMIPLESVQTNTKITFYYSNGNNITWTREKMEAVGFRINDVCYNVNGMVVSGFGRYAIFDVSTVNKVEVRRSETDAFDFITQTQEMVSTDVRLIAETNSNLKDTTRPYIDAKVREAVSKVRMVKR